jgi:fructose-1,6-bisphosphatase/inositol monophosphatase family enzyme
MKKPTIKNLGMFMRIAVDGAIRIAQAEAASFTRIPKVHYDGVQEDLVTSADLKGQDHYETLVNEHFPNDLFVGEEAKIQEEATGSRFTCDPIDGTKAYGRNQSTGTATMFAHANGDDVDAVCVGDINTGEIYQYAPDLSPVRTRFGVTSFLRQEWTLPLEKQYVVLRNTADEFPRNIQKMVRKNRGGIFKDMEVASGSIGINVARLWKQEVAMVVLDAGHDTPWDTTPLVGMNRELGIAHIKVDPATGRAEAFNPTAPTMVQKKDYVEIMVHHTYKDFVVNWLNANL